MVRSCHLRSSAVGAEGGAAHVNATISAVDATVAYIGATICAVAAISVASALTVCATIILYEFHSFGIRASLKPAPLVRNPSLAQDHAARRRMSE